MSEQGIIEGRFVSLRPVERGDVEMIRTWRNSPQVADYHAERDHITVEMQARWFESVQSNNNTKRVWVIEASGKPVGVAHVKDVHPVHQRAELGLYLAEEERRGGPFGTEALYLLIRFSFDQLELHKVYGHYLADNEPARRLNAYFGYVEEGEMREEVFVGGEFRDYIRIGLLEQDFRESEGFRFFDSRKRRA